MAIGLTPKQAQCLAFLRGFQATHGHPPTYREIAAGTGTAAQSVVFHVVAGLIERGHIQKTPDGELLIPVSEYAGTPLYFIPVHEAGNSAGTDMKRIKSS